MTSSDKILSQTSIFFVLAILWKRKYLFLLVFFIFLSLSLYYAISLPNKYSSQALLAPTSNGSNSAISLGQTNFGGLASLAGISLGDQGNSETDLALEIIQSRQFLVSFIEKHKLHDELVAAQGWDKKTSELKYNDKYYDSSTEEWSEKFEDKSLLNWHAYKNFKKIFIVEKNKENPFVTLKITYFSPTLSKIWLEDIVTEINTFVRKKNIDEATRNLEYLNKKMSEIAIAGMREIFYGLIEEEIKKSMVAEVREDYVFTVVDPPVIAQEKSSPSRMLLCVVGALMGCVFGILVIIVLELKSELDRKVGF